MATTLLQGTDWSVGANWSGGTVPDDGDNACIPESLDASVTGGLDQTGKDPDLIRVHELFAKSLGSNGSPLKIAADKIEHYGMGPVYISCAKDGTNARKIDDVLVQAANANVIVELDSVSGDAGDYDNIVLKRGTVRLGGGIQFGASCALHVNRVDRPDDVNFNIASGADTLPTLYQSGGRGVSHGAITTAYVHSGELTQDVAAIGTLHVGPQAIVHYNHTSLTTAIVYQGGTLDLLANSKAKTITTLIAHAGSTVLYDDSLHTFTTFHDYRRARP